jgi:hypothetical protein
MSTTVHVYPTYVFVAWRGTILPLLFTWNFITSVSEEIFIPFPTFGMVMQEENKKLSTAMNMQMYRQLSVYMPHWILK